MPLSERHFFLVLFGRRASCPTKTGFLTLRSRSLFDPSEALLPLNNAACVQCTGNVQPQLGPLGWVGIPALQPLPRPYKPDPDQPNHGGSTIGHSRCYYLIEINYNRAMVTEF